MSDEDLPPIEIIAERESERRARQLVADVYDAAMALYDAESAQDEVEARESKHFVLDGEWDKANKRVCDCIEVLRDACRRAKEGK